MTPIYFRRVVIVACAIGSFVAVRVAKADVDWVINPATSNVTFAGGTWLGGTEYAFTEQAPGTLTAPLSGYFPTNNSFTTNVIFGGSKTVSVPAAPTAPASSDPNYATSYSTYLSNYGTYLASLSSTPSTVKLPTAPQAPAGGTPNYSPSFNAYLNGYSSYLSTYSANVKYGAGAPNFPDKVKSPDGGDPNITADTSAAVAKYGQWADTAMISVSATQNHVISNNTASYQPSFPTPTLPLPLSPVPSTAGPALPGTLAGMMIDDFSTDPFTYTPFVFRNFGQTFFTNTANPTTDPLYPALLPSGAAVTLSNTPTYGQFSQAAIGAGVFANWDVYAPDFFGGQLTGRSPVTETIKNTSLTPGVLSRNGSAYVMTFSSIATKFLQGFKLPDGSRDKSQPDSILDIGTQQTYIVHATANLSPGDVNFDGVVDIQDITLMANHWLQSDQSTVNPGLVPGDANGDGIVDIQDITLSANNWLHTSPGLGGGGGVATVPEPTSIALAAMAALGLICFTRRRAWK